MTEDALAEMKHTRVSNTICRINGRQRDLARDEKRGRERERERRQGREIITKCVVGPAISFSIAQEVFSDVSQPCLIEARALRKLYGSKTFQIAFSQSPSLSCSLPPLLSLAPLSFWVAMQTHWLRRRVLETIRGEICSDG